MLKINLNENDIWLQINLNKQLIDLSWSSVDETYITDMSITDKNNKVLYS
jgi:hypothetical protein